MPTEASVDATGKAVGEHGVTYYDSVSGAVIPVDQSHPLPVAGAVPVAGTASVVSKTASATASGSTAVWTPAAGKKFRLTKYCIEVTAEAALAAGADLVISLLDNATATNQVHSVFVPTTSVTTGLGAWTSGWVDLGTGILSSTINNVLNVNLSAALTSGAVRVIAVGSEE